MLPFIVFVVVTGLVLGVSALLTRLYGLRKERQFDQRMQELTLTPLGEETDASIIKRDDEGPLPGFDRAISGTRAGSWLIRLIEQSGVQTTPSAIVAAALGSGAVCAFVTVLAHVAPFALLAAIFGGSLPILFLKWRRSVRFKKFEEQFPDALDLLARAIRAGHAFPTALGMAAEEMPWPSGPEFKKAFDQQNFGLPLKDALDQLAVRINILDVRFFVTAVVIQRETGGNLAEILDTLSRVVRERFKLIRQVRVHTAHGRFTGYVLLGLPPFLCVALTILNPDFMSLLFRERMGHMMLGATMVMQVIGFFWIKKIITIEV